MAVTLDYQFEYVAGGVTLAFGYNTATEGIDLVRFSGLQDIAVLDGDREFSRFDGHVPGIHRAEPRYVRLEMEVRGTPGSTYDDLVNSAINVFKRRTFEDGVLTFMLPGTNARFIRCRTVRRRIVRDARTEYGLLPIDVELKASDPRMYDALVTPSASSGTFSINPGGSDWAYPILNFGSVANAEITNNTNGDNLEIVGATGSGSLIADMDRFIRGTNELIVYRGSTDNYPVWVQPRKPFRLEPNVSNSLTLNTGTNVVVGHYPTYL